MPMVHNIGSIPDFRDERADSPISEIALRVVVERDNWRLNAVGTATLITGHLAMTAKHVLEYAMRTFGSKQKSAAEIEIDAFELKLYQVLPGPAYRIWGVAAAWPCNTFFVVDPRSGKRVNVGVVRTAGHAPYLRTYADGIWTDNLLSLDQCPL